jgi:hypothetical protein
VIGLLARAHQLRTSIGLPGAERDEFAFDPDSGISREEQGEIRREIERIATQNRMAVSPRAFVVKAAKRGILFPGVVMAAAIFSIGVGLAVFYFLFQRGETLIAREDTATITAEGKLIQEVKKESEARLHEKNQQINQIQGQLAEIDRQRQDLQANMDAKVQGREAQLRAALATELDAERTRLQKQGLSDQDIEKKLADLEAQKNAAFVKQIDAFRAQAEGEREKAEATLKDLQAQFNANLAKANTERQQVLTDSRQKEADLQAELTKKTEELQSAQAQTQAQLQALATQKQQEDLVMQQLEGLYAVVQADISSKDFAKALISLKAISTYVNSGDVIALPGIAKRRTVDLFIVDSLSSLAQEEIDKGKVDTSSIVDAANQISEVRSRVARADGLLRAGNLSEAESLYAQALGMIPEIAKSYAYFTDKAREAERTRVDALNAGLARAESAFDAGQYADSLSAYKAALAYVPESSARLDKVLSNIGAAARAQASQKAQAAQSRAAAPVLRQANATLRQGQFADALSQYLTILSAYPQSAQTAEAMGGISKAAAALNGQAGSSLKEQSDQVAALNGRLVTLQRQLDASTGEIIGIKRSVITLLGTQQNPATADSTALMTALNQRYGNLANATSVSSNLQGQLGAANQKNAQLTATLTRLNADNARLSTDLSAAREEAARQAGLAAAKALALPPTSPESTGNPATSMERKVREFENLVASYLEYAAKEDANIAKYEEQKALMLSVGSRDSFLAMVSRFFDGLLVRVKRYDAQSSAAGIETGRKRALDDVIDVMTGLANQKSPDKQRSYLDSRMAAEKDLNMKNLLGYLQRILASR